MARFLGRTLCGLFFWIGCSHQLRPGITEGAGKTGAAEGAPDVGADHQLVFQSSHQGFIAAVAVSSDGGLLASAEHSTGLLKLWDLLHLHAARGLEQLAADRDHDGTVTLAELRAFPGATGLGADGGTSASRGPSEESGERPATDCLARCPPEQHGTVRICETRLMVPSNDQLATRGGG
jgi:hypothetical protein